MDAFFFRVEHDLLRSEAFKALGGSAIKVYLIIGLYSDFGTGWAYPSIRTIARQGGMSRQTVLDAIGELTRHGLLATSKAPGKSTAYRVLREGPERTRPVRKQATAPSTPTVPEFFQDAAGGGPDPFQVGAPAVLESSEALASFLGLEGPTAGPKQEPRTREEDNASIPIPGTPFRLTTDGRILVAVDVQQLLTSQGLSPRTAEKIARRRDPQDVAKVLLNALYLQSQGKLHNGPGYIRAAIEDGYELLPQVASRLEVRRRELQDGLRAATARRVEQERVQEQESEEAAIALLLESLRPDDLQRLVDRAVAALPGPIVRRNPTLSNPFVRAKVYELAGGSPAR